MDLGKFDTVATSDEGTEMILRHPVTSAPLYQDDLTEKAVTITLAGADSSRFRAAERANRNKRLKGLRMRTPSAEEIDEDGLELLSRCTLAWDGVELDGQVLACTQANARMLYKRLPWVREQVDNFMGDRANFLAPLPKS
jgi:hypothetical protein